MKKNGEPHVWLEEGEEEISSFLSHTYNAPKRRRESQRERRKWGESGEKMKDDEKRNEKKKEKKMGNEIRKEKRRGERKEKISSVFQI